MPATAATTNTKKAIRLTEPAASTGRARFFIFTPPDAELDGIGHSLEQGYSDVSIHTSVYTRLAAQVLVSRVVSRGRRNTGSKSTRGSFKTQGLSRPLIQAQRYFVQVRLREARQIGFLG
jgi:hypothetical protein